MALASASAANAAAKAIVPPASSFAELLRRSRFASYDPAIAQTYTAPPAYARRGNYGLKRSVPMTYKDSYITVNHFEHHAQFTEWNNAEAPVKFLKRVEETNVLPRNITKGEWDESLGEARTQWLIDSEFAEHNYSPQRQEVPYDAQGQRGPGGYGAKRPPPQTLNPSPGVDGNLSQINVSALSSQQFGRYLSKLRDLSPKYREYLLEQHKARHLTQAKRKGISEAEAEEDFEEDDLLLYITSVNDAKLHRRFLGKRFSSTNSSPPSPPSTSPTTPAPEKIERQPHRIGGLTYHHFSPLDTLLTTPPQPGLIMQIEPRYNASFSETRFSTHKQDYVSLFSGLISRISKTNAGIHTPFYNPDGLNAVGPDPNIDPDKIVQENPNAIPAPPTDPKTDPLCMNNSIAKLRMIRLTLRTPPMTVVGYKAHQTKPQGHLKSMSLNSEVTVDTELALRNIRNPHRPGSREYSGHLEVNNRNRFGLGLGALSEGPNGGIVTSPRFAPPGRKAALKPIGFGSLFEAKNGRKYLKRGEGETEELEVREDRTNAARKTLKGMLGKIGTGAGNGSDGLGS